MPSILFLTAYPTEDASCRYRIHQFVPFLEAAGFRCTISSFANERLFRNLRIKGGLLPKVQDVISCSYRRFRELQDLSGFDLVVIHREAFPFFQPVVEHWLLRRHHNVIFSFDDAIYAGHEDTSQLSHPLLYKFKHGAGYDSVMRSCAHVIAGNRILADYARRLTPNVSVIPTVVDTNRYQFAPPDRPGLQRLTIGWIGSRSTASYLKIVEPALRRLAAAYPGKARFLFVGCPEHTVDVPGATSVSFSLERELQDLHSIDIGLMPLPDSEWARGKCAFKAIQYMASGAVTVASPVGANSDLIKDGVNGLLTTSEEQWFSAIERLIFDSQLRQRLATAARHTIEAEYSLQLWGPRMVALFNRLLGMSPTRETSGMAA